MEIEDRETHAKRGRGNTGDALTSSMAGFRRGVAHYRTTVGSRDRGQSAAAKFDYMNREGKYEKGRDELGYTESGNMPEWAKERPREYWEAADKYERANGRLFVHHEFALPRELTEQQQIALVQEAAQMLARTKAGEPLPYSFAIHSPKGRNPHFHIEISERALDGWNRTPELWFKRHPIGAKKTTDFQPKAWVFETRCAWCDLTNKHLEREGINTRLDPRTLKAQGIDRIPEIRVGYTDPKRPHIRRERQERNEAIKLANRLPEAQQAVAKADKQIAELTAILRDIEAREKAAAVVKAQEQKPEPPRQVHDQAQQTKAQESQPRELDPWRHERAWLLGKVNHLDKGLAELVKEKGREGVPGLDTALRSLAGAEAAIKRPGDPVQSLREFAQTPQHPDTQARFNKWADAVDQGRQQSEQREIHAGGQTMAPAPPAKAPEPQKPEQLTPEEAQQLAEKTMLAEKARLLTVAKTAETFKERFAAQEQAKKIEATYLRTLTPYEQHMYKQRQAKTRGKGL